MPTAFMATTHMPTAFMATTPMPTTFVATTFVPTTFMPTTLVPTAFVHRLCFHRRLCGHCLCGGLRLCGDLRPCDGRAVMPAFVVIAVVVVVMPVVLIPIVRMSTVPIVPAIAAAPPEARHPRTVVADVPTWALPAIVVPAIISAAPEVPYRLEQIQTFGGGSDHPQCRPAPPVRYRAATGHQREHAHDQRTRIIASLEGQQGHQSSNASSSNLCRGNMFGFRRRMKRCCMSAYSPSCGHSHRDF